MLKQLPLWISIYFRPRLIQIYKGTYCLWLLLAFLNRSILVRKSLGHFFFTVAFIIRSTVFLTCMMSWGFVDMLWYRQILIQGVYHRKRNLGPDLCFGFLSFQLSAFDYDDDHFFISVWEWIVLWEYMMQVKDVITSVFSDGFSKFLH